MKIPSCLSLVMWCCLCGMCSPLSGQASGFKILSPRVAEYEKLIHSDDRAGLLSGEFMSVRSSSDLSLGFMGHHEICNGEHKREIRPSDQDEGREFQFSTYEETRKHLGELFQQKNYRKAADLLEWALKRFPDHLLANAYNLALMYLYLGELEQSVQALDYGLDGHIFYSRYAFGGEIWAPLKETDAFKKITERNEALIKEAQKKAKAEIFVVEPEGFSESKRYPLFIALHGGGENVAAFQPNWTSPQLKKEFIVAYLQSSKVVAMDGFSWTEDMEVSKREIREAYRTIIEDYLIDLDSVFVGGFSSGGVAALEMALSDLFPIAGFISLCPARPEDFSAERVREAKKRGVSGMLLTTEMDPRLSDQKEMAGIFHAEDFPLEFIVTPNIGHWYPEDMETKIDQAIDFIRQGMNRKIG